MTDFKLELFDKEDEEAAFEQDGPFRISMDDGECSIESLSADDLIPERVLGNDSVESITGSAWDICLSSIVTLGSGPILTPRDVTIVPLDIYE